MKELEMCERRKKKPGVKECSQGKKMKKMKRQETQMGKNRIEEGTRVEPGQ
jgi:hypothetical protein